MNKCIEIGRLATDPDLRDTQGGSKVCNFRIAVNRKFKAEGRPTADFFNCVAWGKTGEFVNKYFEKGKMIVLEGRFENRDWTDDEDKKHYVTEFMVDAVEFCGDKGSDNSRSKKTEEPDEDYEENEDELPF